MSKTFKFVTSEDNLQVGPKYELRSGDENRNETDQNFLPPTVLGWPKTKSTSEKENVKINKITTEYRDNAVSSPESTATENESSFCDVDEKLIDETEHFEDTELETSLRRLTMAMAQTIKFRQEATEERNSNEQTENSNSFDMQQALDYQQANHRARVLEIASRIESQETEIKTVEDKEETLNEKEAVAMAKAIFSVSDSVIAPRPFTGKTSENDAESWLEFFELYSKHRGLNNSERLTLFPLMMRNGAADWLATLPKTQLQSYDSLVTAFWDNYFVPAELRWKEAGMLWNQSQREDEQVEDDFVTRVRRGARRIQLADSQLVDIILNGLRPSIRLHVLQKGGDTLNDLIKTAKLAEAVTPAPNDTTSALLLK